MSSDRERTCRLFDFYGSLLTEKQQRIFEYYYLEDYTMQEIADEESVSRSAVHDMLKRVRTEMEEYEAKLHLVYSFETRMSLYEQIRTKGSKQISDLIDLCIETEIEGGKND